jgi:hypothetical protein
LPEGCSLHVVVYAVPSRLCKVVRDALVGRVRDWADCGRALVGEAGGLVAYLDLPDRLSVEPWLPNWV